MKEYKVSGNPSFDTLTVTIIINLLFSTFEEFFSDVSKMYCPSLC